MTASFPGTQAVDVALAYGIFQTVVLRRLELRFGR
jgi:hypothetical protein